MTNKIKTFAKHSYVQGRLDEETVTTIANHLGRRQLKDYIRLLKQQENKNTVIIVTALPLQMKAKENLVRFFPGKELLYTTDQNMISGIRIIDNDREYEISINKLLHDIMSHITIYD